MLTLFRTDREGGGGGPPTSFSFVTSTNVRISTQNFLNFSFNPFAIFQGHIYSQSQIIKLKPTANLKKIGFSSQILLKLRLW